MICVIPPDEFEGDQPSVFLAGGISDCDAWQPRIVDMLAGTNLAILNPRRPIFPKDQPAEAVRQIAWEYRHLRRATARLFWFPFETLCPIALFELGAWTRTDEPLFVGVHPDYGRRFDVEIQLSLSRSDVEIVYELQQLAGQVSVWEKSR